MTRARITWLIAAAVAGWWLAEALSADDAPQPVPAAAPASAPEAGERSTAGPAQHEHGPRVFLAGRRDESATTQPDDRGARRGLFMASIRHSPPLTDEQIVQVGQFLHAEQPAVADALDKLKQDDPAEYAARMQRIGPATLYMMDLKHRDPARYSLIVEDMKLGQRINKLASAVLDADDAARKSELTERLRTELDKRFEVHQKRQRLEIASLRKRIERLDQMLQLREARKDSIIEQQLKMALDREAARRARAAAADKPADDDAPDSPPPPPDDLAPPPAE